MQGIIFDTDKNNTFEKAERRLKKSFRKQPRFKLPAIGNRVPAHQEIYGAKLPTIETSPQRRRDSIKVRVAAHSALK